MRVPHRDGMLPVVSTRQLSNFELTLSKDGTRLATHRCSNLLDYNEVSAACGWGIGFLCAFLSYRLFVRVCSSLFAVFFLVEGDFDLFWVLFVLVHVSLVLLVVVWGEAWG